MSTSVKVTAGELLSKYQAAAVYAAMVACNNVQARVTVKFGLLEVSELYPGLVYVWLFNDRDKIVAGEAYTGQVDFAAAYGLETT